MCFIDSGLAGLIRKGIERVVKFVLLFICLYVHRVHMDIYRMGTYPHASPAYLPISGDELYPRCTPSPYPECVSEVQVYITRNTG